MIADLTKQATVGQFFDLIEFFLTHPNVSSYFKADIEKYLAKGKAAYRVFDGEIAAVGTDEQAQAVTGAVNNPCITDAARTHLIQAGVKLKAGEWADSIRESIHAVESIAVKFSSNSTTLGAALAELEKSAHLHGALKSAFVKLYGYTSDQEGIRHAIVFEGEVNVDEADAIFMLGACAAFVSYLLARLQLHKKLSPED